MFLRLREPGANPGTIVLGDGKMSERACKPVSAFMVAAFMAVASAGTAADATWITSWATAPLPPGPAMGPMAATPSFNNRTLRQILRLSAGGDAVRVRFTNAYGARPLAIGGARIAMIDASGQEIAGSSRTLTFAGAKTATALRAAPLLSDPVRLKVPPLARVAISTYFPGDTGPCTCHQVGLDETQISAPGDFVGKPFRPQSVTTSRAFLASVEVDALEGAATVAVLGDSISDGVGSTAKANRRWPDLLADRLAARGGRVWGVANQGISGNRVLADGMGESALARLDRDVLSLPGVKAVIVFEGVNDLGMSFGTFEGPAATAMAAFRGTPIDAAQMIAGYRQIIDRAHAQGVRVYGATIAPYKGATYWTPAGEAARQAVNRFIRSGGAFDAVIDFDHAFADPADPAKMRDGYHMGDFLHGTDAGYKAAADSIDLALFQ
jgi:lysophospholipase L1-like esterase